MTTHEPTVRPVRYTVTCVPGDDIDASVYGIDVEYRGEGRWAVTRRRCCLGADGEWDYEPIPSARDDGWLAAHRFDRDTALRLAREAAPHVTYRGRTVADALRRQADPSRGGGSRL